MEKIYTKYERYDEINMEIYNYKLETSKNYYAEIETSGFIENRIWGNFELYFAIDVCVK